MEKNIKSAGKTIALILLVFCVVVSTAASINADNHFEREDKLIAGVISIPPFIIKYQEGVFDGVSVRLLQTIATELEKVLEIREYDSGQALKEALLGGEVHLLPVVGMSEEIEEIFDFSNPYHRSGLAIAVKIRDKTRTWLHIVWDLFSVYFLKVAPLLLLVWIVAGTLVWVFERRKNEEVFGDRLIKGIGHGIWWASVTMTTVGYGDKAPETPGGRAVAIVWMFVSIILISGFTATVTSSLTIGELKGKIQDFSDLHKVRVGTLEESNAVDYLAHNGIFALPFKGVQEGLEAVADGRIDAFVSDEGALRYLATTQYPGHLHVLAKTFDHYFLGMAMLPENTIREPLNRALLRATSDSKWERWMNQYLGASN